MNQKDMELAATMLLKAKMKGGFVQSSWLYSLNWFTYDQKDDGICFMSLILGKTYMIEGISEDTFDDWYASASKGGYFNAEVKGQY